MCVQGTGCGTVSGRCSLLEPKVDLRVLFRETTGPQPFDKNAAAIRAHRCSAGCGPILPPDRHALRFVEPELNSGLDLEGLGRTVLQAWRVLVLEHSRRHRGLRQPFCFYVPAVLLLEEETPYAFDQPALDLSLRAKRRENSNDFGGLEAFPSKNVVICHFAFLSLCGRSSASSSGALLSLTKAEPEWAPPLLSDW